MDRKDAFHSQVSAGDDKEEVICFPLRDCTVMWDTSYDKVPSGPVPSPL